MSEQRLFFPKSQNTGTRVGFPYLLFGQSLYTKYGRGLVRFPQTKALAVYHDNPEITEADKLRSSACLTVPAGTKGEGEIGTMAIPGGLFAVAHAEIAPDEFGAAWTALMGGWLPESGYQPDDRLCYEVYLNDPKEHPAGKFIIEICEPVKPL